MKKKILFVNDEMVVGGVSKVLNNLLRHMDREKYEMHLLVLHKHGEMLKDIPEDIKVIEGTSFFDVCDIPVKDCIKSGKFLKKLFFFLSLRLVVYVKFSPAILAASADNFPLATRPSR